MAQKQLGSPRDLFAHKLGQALTAEKMSLKVLPKLAKEAQDEGLAQGLRKHLEQTREQVQTVEEAFSGLGIKALGRPNPVLDALVAEHEEAASAVSPELRDAMTMATAAKIEHLETSMYTELVTMARAMGETQTARTLEGTLKQEKQMAREVEKLARQRTRELVKAEGGNGARR